MVSLVGGATRTRGCVEEHLGWLDGESARPFVVIHEPAKPTSALVVCSPIGPEFDANYRREVLLARQLADQGVAVLRLQYRGVGNSFGPTSDLTLDSMVRDVCGAAVFLAGRLGIEPAILGTRAACFVALRAAALLESPSVVLWQPPDSGAAYCREMMLVRRAEKWRQHVPPVGVRSKSLVDELDEWGRTGVAGYELHSRLFNQLSEARLDDTELSERCDLLAVQFGREETGPALASQLVDWGRSIRVCEVRVLPDRLRWWFGDDSPIEQCAATGLAHDLTGEWLLDRPGPPAVDRPSGTWAASPADFEAEFQEETSSLFDEQVRVLPSPSGDLCSVLTTPAWSNGIGVVVLAGGRNEQSAGRNRVSRRLAQDLAQIGFHSIRLDYHGVGDSWGVVDPDVLANPYDQQLQGPFIADASAAVDELQRVGVERVVLIGDCFGARTALALGADRDLVAGLVLVSLPWGDRPRIDRRTNELAARLSITQVLRRACRPQTLVSLADPFARRTYRRLLQAKLSRHHSWSSLSSSTRRRVPRWLSHEVVHQLERARGRELPVLLVYGKGPAEEYAHEFDALRQSGVPTEPLDVALDEVQEVRLEQPIAGYRDLKSQVEVTGNVVRWLSEQYTGCGRSTGDTVAAAGTPADLGTLGPAR